jgi:hypothetical protein
VEKILIMGYLLGMNLSQDSQSPNQDSNLQLLKYKAALINHLTTGISFLL